MADPPGKAPEVTFTLEDEDEEVTDDSDNETSPPPHPPPPQPNRSSRGKDVVCTKLDNQRRNQTDTTESVATPDLVVSSRKSPELTENPQYVSSDTEQSAAEGGKTTVTKSPTVRFSYSSKGDNSEAVEVIEFADTEMTEADAMEDGSCRCGPRRGPHIVILTVLCFPVAMILSFFGSSYFGALTWYNFLTYFNEERTVWHKIFICPVLILTFPITVGFTSVGISLYAACVQISWSLASWRRELLDAEKGFYGWMCEKVCLPMCSPYDIVPYNDESELEPMRT